MPWVGSSNRNMSAAPSSQRAITTFCWLPPLNVRILAWAAPLSGRRSRRFSSRETSEISEVAPENGNLPVLGLRHLRRDESWRDDDVDDDVDSATDEAVEDLPGSGHAARDVLNQKLPIQSCASI